MAVRFSPSRLWTWTAPLLVGGAAALVFGVGFVLALRGTLGEPLGEPPPAARKEAVVLPTGDKGAVRILVLGDSLAKGTGDETGKGFAVRVVEAFRAAGPAELTNLAVNGMETPEVLALVDTPNVRALARSASLILVSTGGNDLSHGATSLGGRGRETPVDLSDAVTAARGRYVDGLQKILEILREENPSAPIGILGLYDPFGSASNGGNASGAESMTAGEAGVGRLGASVILQWNELAQQTALAFPNVFVVPSFDLFQGRADRLSADRYHPNGAAYAAIAARMLQLFGKS
jgi:lysophospholipase L1-like esterase